MSDLEITTSAATYTENQSVEITAKAKACFKPIRVAFYANGVPIRTKDYSKPWIRTLENMLPGTYDLMAVGTDAKGKTQQSNHRTVTVTAATQTSPSASASASASRSASPSASASVSPSHSVSPSPSLSGSHSPSASPSPSASTSPSSSVSHSPSRSPSASPSRSASSSVSPSASPSMVPPPPEGLLSSDDFTYLGAIYLPYDQEGWSESRGAMTGRIVGGQQRLFIGGAESNVERLFEIALPDVNNLPGRATVVRAWGDVSQGNLLGSNPAVVKMYIRGVKWLEDRQRLLWNYTPFYGTIPSPGDPCMGLSRLNSDGTIDPFGPWRTTLSYDLSVGPVLDVPADFQAAYGVGPYAVASPQYTQVSFLGANLHGFSVPADNTPRDLPQDYNGPEGTHQTIAMTRMLYHGLSHPQPKTVESAVYSCSGGRTLTPDVAEVLPAVFGGGEVHAGETLDNWLSSVWIRTATKQAVVKFGVQQRAGHNWYGNYPREDPGQPPTGECWHGETSRFGGGIGNSGSSAHHMFALYDPADLGAVVAGSKNSWDPAPYQMDTADTFAQNSGFVPKNAYETNSPTVGAVGAYTYRFGGAHHEPTTGLLYLVENSAEFLNNNLLSKIHVFQLPL